NRDKRNLYLAKEGLIYPESPAAEGVSQTDLKKRLAARVMCDRHKNDQKFGKSKGFGFIAFTEHIHALKALRQLNNNPNIFTSDKRPIVEFSIENKVALNKKKHRMNRNADNQKNGRQSDQTEHESTEQSVEYSGVMSKPNKLNEKIKAPKVNRKLGVMQKQLKTRKKGLKKNKTKEFNEKRHQEKVEKRNARKKETIEIQDTHDRHYMKRKNIFKDDNNQKNDSKPR
ncbi:unnamed protein product, partial [Medioppia subpectinata]